MAGSVERMIPVFRPKMRTQKILPRLAEILDSGWIGLGPVTAEFEKRFAEYIGAKHAVALNSATAALHLSLLAAGVGPGDEVIVPSLTFVSTALAALYVGAAPVFGDIDPDTLNLDPGDVARKITQRTRAVIPVHFGGHPCNLDAFCEVAERHDVTLIEDCAHACGASYHDRSVGTFGLCGCFSFHAVKNLATGDGGMITTNDTRVADRLKRLRWVGIDRSTADRTSATRYSWQYSIDELGFKAHMNDITAAIGLVQLAYVDEDNRRRAEIAQLYQECLSAVDWVQTPREPANRRSAWHNYVIRVPARHRDALCDHLAQRGIATSVHYYPVHKYRLFHDCDSHVPVSESVWQSLLTLPMFPDLSDEEVRRIAREIASFPTSAQESAERGHEPAEDGCGSSDTASQVAFPSVKHVGR